MKDLMTFQGVVSAVWSNGAIVTTPSLGEVFVHGGFLSKHHIVWGAQVKGKCAFSSEQSDSRRRVSKYKAIQILGAVPSKSEGHNAECYGTVKWFNGLKGVITLIPGNHPWGAAEVEFSGKVCPDKLPERDDAVGCFIEQTDTGLKVNAIEHNTTIVAAVEALLHTPSDGRRRYLTEGGLVEVTDAALPGLPHPPKPRF